MRKLEITLVWQIFIALIMGILLGSFLHGREELCTWMITNILSPIGNIFIRMVKMIVIPIVVVTLIIGIAGISDVRKLSSIGFKTILYFEIVTTLAIFFGITLANIFHPGYGINISKLRTMDISKYEQAFTQANSYKHNFSEIILSMIPENIFSSIANGDMLSIIFFSVFFGIALSSLQKGVKELLLNLFNAIMETMCKITHIVMYYAPLGVFSLISVTVATFGFASLLSLAKLVLLVYCAIIFFALIVLGGIARLFQLRILTIIYILKEELILAFSTASSESVLPNIINKMKSYGASDTVTSFVVSTGYSFNLDGSTLYQSITAIFIAQMYGISLSLNQEILLVLTLMITSKGIAGIPGISFIVLLVTLNSINIPPEGLVFISGVDRILDMARTALNVIGNALAVLIIAKWENQYDYVKAIKYEKKIFAK